jgi:hypothetical protein
MNARRSTFYPFFGLFAAILLLLTACQPAALATSQAPLPLQPTQPPTQPSATPVIVVAQAPAAQPTQPASGAPAHISLAFPAVAQSATVETVPAVPAGDFVAWTEVMPQHNRLPLQGYPVADHELKPQIYIYPAGELASANENAGKAAADLQALLQTQQAGDQLPFLPLMFSVKQTMHAQVQYLDFKSGKGVRFLTQFNNGMAPINNRQLTYTFQGLTSDGKYYIAAVLPVTHPALPADSQGNGQVVNDYQNYLSTTVTMLNQQPADSFSPGLNVLDTLIRSLEVK